MNCNCVKRLIPVFLIALVLNLLPRFFTLPDFLVGFSRGLIVGLFIGGAIALAIGRWTSQPE